MKKKIITLISRQFLLLLLTCGLATANEPELQKIRYTVLSPTSEEVALQLNGSYIPKTFTLKDETPRIIFDFPDMIYGREIKSNITTKGAIVKRIRVGMHDEEAKKTRIVFDVATLTGVNYTQRFDEKSSTLTIQFTTKAKATAAVAGTKKAAAADKRSSPLADTAEKTDEKKNTAAPIAQVQPEMTGTSPAIARTEATQADRDIKPEPTVQTTTPQPPVTAGKTEENKTLAPPTTQPHPDATANAKSPAPPETVQTNGQTKPELTAQATTPQPPVTTAKAEENKTLAPPTTQPHPDATANAKSPAPPETAQADGQAKPELTAQATTPQPQPPVTAEKTEENKTLPPPTTQPHPDATANAKSPALPETAQADGQAKPEPTAHATTDSKTSTKTDKPAPADGAEVKPLLEFVKFDGTSPRGETVKFKLNGFHPPTVHGIVEGIPRVVCEFSSTQLADATKNTIKTDGKYVKFIRISKTKKPEGVRVVLDLEPNRSYDLQQVFFKEDNFFVIIVNTTKK